jgi:hypothetical protein
MRSRAISDTDAEYRTGILTSSSRVGFGLHRMRNELGGILRGGQSRSCIFSLPYIISSGAGSGPLKTKLHLFSGLP